MRKDIIVIVIISILISISVIVGFSFIVEKINKNKIEMPDYITTESWLEETGKPEFYSYLMRVEGMDCVAESYKSGIFLDIRYSNLKEVLKNKKLKRDFLEKFRKLNILTTLNLSVYGIELDKANCIINIRDKKNSKVSFSIVNGNIIAF